MVLVDVEVGVTSWVGKVLLVDVVVLVDVFDAVDVGEFGRAFIFRFLFNEAKDIYDDNNINNIFNIIYYYNTTSKIFIYKKI